MASSAPTLRELARSLGLSHTTVSEALRDSPRVKPETRALVLKAAKQAGYKYNPLAGALMSEMRRSRAGIFRGVVAILDMDGPEKRKANSECWHAEMTQGATERASELGFKAELFVMGHRGLTSTRLDTILQSRGIRGVFLLPVGESPDLSSLDWSKYSGVYADYIMEHPALHTICADHYRSMATAMQRVHALGYKRPGLVIQQHLDERLLYRWEASFKAYQEHHEGMEKLAPLLTADLKREEFITWFKKMKPDVVLCHRHDVVPWMEECGASVPRTHGFCCLNVSLSVLACAGLDLQPRLLGARGMELIIAQLYRNEYGVPQVPSTTTIAALWKDGPTLRKQ
jgi:LacI family transcriptional regulator